MYKLKGHGLELGQWFLPESQSMTLTERGSTSSITLGPDGPEIGFDDWLLDDEWREGRIIWRVKSIDDQTDTGTRTINLEHIIRTLEDIQIFDAIETSDISGGDYATNKQTIEYLLARQSDWVLGTIKESISQPYEFSGGESVYDAIESVCDTMEDAEWWYDLSVYPFRLNIQKRSETVYSEMRGGRNVSTLRRSVNRSGMYTRIWPVGENDLHISGSYLSKNEKNYGRVDKVETNQSRTSEASLKAWAQGLLNKHCEPVVTITISGLDLAEETGESLDWIRLNRVCRCPLPEYKTTILERVIKIAWKDRIADPESITVTLGNNTADATELTKTISESTKSSGKGARGQAKQNYLFEANGEHLLYEVFDECGHLHGVLRVTSESLRTAFENLNNSTRSEMILTSESLRVHFENEISCTRSQMEMTSESLRVQFENEISSTRSEIEMTSESLRTHFENEINSTRSDFQITSESLRTYFENLNNSTRSEFQITSESLRTSFERELDSAWSAIDANADSISLKVGKGDVATQLAVEMGNVSVKNGNLTVEGMVTADAVKAAAANITDLTVGGVIRATNYYFGTGAIPVSIGSGVYDMKIEQSGDDYSLYKQTYANGEWRLVKTFSRATSLKGEWSGGTFTVIASPQKESTGARVYAAISDTPSSTAAPKILKVPIKVYSYTGGSSTPEETGYSGNLLANAAPIYENGWKAAYGKFSSKTVSATDNNLWVNYPTNTVDADAATRNYYVTCDGDYAYIRINSTSGTAVARCDNVYEAVDITLQGDSESITPIGSTYVQPSASMPGTYYKGNGTRLGSSGTYYKGNGTRLKSATYYPGNGTRLGASGTYYKGNGARYSLATRYPHGTRLTTATRYKEGSDVTYYQGGSSFTYYDIGSDTTVYTTNGQAKLKYIGTITGQSGYYYKIDSSGDQWGKITKKTVTRRTGYLRGSSVTVTKQGDSETVYVAGNGSYYLCGTGESVLVANDNGSAYLRGDSVTAYPVDSSGSHYLRGTGAGVYIADSNGTYYLRGDSVTAYPTDSSGSNYLRGDSISAYPYDKDGTKYYQAASAITRYKAGTRYNKTDYYKKKS